MLPNKRELFLQALDTPHGPHAIVTLTIDPTNGRVELPPGLTPAPDGSIVLNYSRWFSHAPDARRDGVACVQSFDEVDYPTFVPWAAVRSLLCCGSGTFVVWLREPLEDVSAPPSRGLRIVPDDPS